MCGGQYEYMRVSLRNRLFVSGTKITLDSSWLQKDHYISVCSNYLFNLIKVIIHLRIYLESVFLKKIVLYNYQIATIFKVVSQRT